MSKTLFFSCPVAGKSIELGGPFRVLNQVRAALEESPTFREPLPIISGEGMPSPADSLASGEAFDTFASIDLEDELLQKFPNPDLFLGVHYDSLLQMRVLKRLSPKTKRVTLTMSTESRYAHTVVTPEYKKHGVDEPYPEVFRYRGAQEENLVDAIISPGEFCSNTWRIAPEMKGKKVYPVEFGVDSDTFSPAKEFPTDRLRIMFAGGNIMRKGLSYLLDAWGNFMGNQLPSRRGTSASMTIVGADKRHFSSQIPRTIKIKGWVNEAELPDIYRAHNLFVLPSLEEGMALAVLEAMASGIPVLTTVEAGYKDIITDGKEGWIIPSKNPMIIEAKLKYASHSLGELRQMGKNARKLALTYTWERFRKQIVETLESI